MRALPSHQRPGFLSPVLLAAIALAGVGCGSSHTAGTGADPAGAIPAAAPLYAGATVRPAGPLKAAALAAGRALTRRADPYVNLLRALQTPGSTTPDFNRDVAPWLGARAGIFITSSPSAGEANAGRLLALLGQGLLGGSSTASAFPFGATGAQGAIVLDASDPTKARSFLDSRARLDSAHATAYRGVSYQAGAGDVAFGVVHRFAVIGSESALHSVIDTALGGPSLARSADYSKLLASAPPDALAHVYANGSVFHTTTPAGQAPGARASQSEGLGGLLRLLVGTRTVNISLVPSASTIALDADSLRSAQLPARGSGAAPGGLLASVSEGAATLSELPGDSWLAVGLGNVGGTLAEDVQGLRGLVSVSSSLSGSSSTTPPAGGISVNGLLEGFLAPLRALGASDAEARHDFQSWMGPAGIFASGAGLLELKGAVVIASQSPVLSRAAVAKLATRLRRGGGSVQGVSIPGTEAAVSARLSGLPVALDIAAGRNASGQARFVIGIGEASVAAALNPPSTLAGAASRSAAAATLGEGIEPTAIVDFPTLLSMLEGAGLAEDPTISQFVPYLRSLGTVAGGGKSLGGGVDRFRLLAGLRPAG